VKEEHGMTLPSQPDPEGQRRDRVAAVAGLVSVAAFVAGQYVAPALVWPEEQVGGVQRSFYANFEGRLLAQAVLFGVAAGLFLVLLGGLRDAVVVAAGALSAGLVLLQTAALVALVTLRGSELAVQAQDSAWAARALFYLEGAVGDVALFPFAVFLAAAALRHAGALPRWLAAAGVAAGLLVGGLAVGTIVGLDIGPGGQLVFLLVSAWVAVLAWSVGWPRPSAVDGAVPAARRSR
jgi:hypothetical protein